MIQSVSECPFFVLVVLICKVSEIILRMREIKAYTGKINMLLFKNKTISAHSKKY